MIKPIISALILVTHVACICTYNLLNSGYKAEHKAICVILFYCSTLLLPALNNIIINCEDTAYRNGIFLSHNLFCLVIGTIYALHYTGLIISDYLTISIFCSCFFTIFTILVYNLIRYGLLKKNGRN